MIYIKNRAINEDIRTILKHIRAERLKDGESYFKDIHGSLSTLQVTCPCHKNHNENHPSCGVFLEDRDNFKEGSFHCFTCGATGSLSDLVNVCFEQTGDFGERWLIENFSSIFVEYQAKLRPIDIDTKKEEFLSESVLDKYSYYHEYMWKRKLSKEVVDLFEVGYDIDKQALVFPVRDTKGRLVFLTRRSVNTKFFSIPEAVDKPVYLLYYALQKNLDTVAVCESQINALTCYSYGIPAVALFGTGSKSQYEILKKSGIRRFILMFDGDNAGRRGVTRFIKHMPKDRMIDVVNIPNGKDVNDFTKEELWKLLEDSFVKINEQQVVYI